MKIVTKKVTLSTAEKQNKVNKFTINKRASYVGSLLFYYIIGYTYNIT